MRRATATLAVCLCLALAGLAVGGFATADLTDGGSQSGLTAAWVSETPRDNELNHHAVGVGPAVSSDGFEDASTGDGSVGRDSRADPVVVAPVTSLPRTNETRTRTDCALVRLAAADGSAVWRQGVAPEHCFSHAFTAPAVADVDGDGTVEVVAGTAAERLVVRDGRSGRLAATASLSAYGYGRPAVTNLSAGPGQSVVASDVRGQVLRLDDGEDVRWRTNLSTAFDGQVTVWDDPAVVDVDADGAPEVAIGTASGPAILGADGTVEWTGERPASALSVAQTDADGQLELVAVDGRRLSVIDGRDHAVQWERSFGTLARARAVAPVDGRTTVFVGLANGTVLALDAADGDVRWRRSVATGDDAVLTAPVLADRGGTTSPAVVVATRAGTVSALDATDGRLVGTYRRPVPVWTAPTAADLDGDAADELLVRYGDGRVAALDLAADGTT